MGSIQTRSDKISTSGAKRLCFVPHVLKLLYDDLDWLSALIFSFNFFFSSGATLDQKMTEPLFLDKNAL